MRLLVLLFLLLGLLCLVSVVSAVSITFDDTSYNGIDCRIKVTGSGTTNFYEIYQYFKANPIPELYFPRELVVAGLYGDLAEQNENEWYGRYGFDDVVASGDAMLGSESMTTVVMDDSVYSEDIISISNLIGGRLVRIVVDDNASFVIGDLVVVSGTVDYDALYFIESISSVSSGMRLNTRGGIIEYGHTNRLVDAGTENVGNVSLYHTISYNMYGNDARFGNYGNRGVFNIGSATHIEFWMKKENGELGTLAYISTTHSYLSDVIAPDSSYYGMHTEYLGIDVELDEWMFYSLPIRDTFYMRNDDRSYLHRVYCVSFHFDGLLDDTTVFLDGVRFANYDPNPKYIPPNTYEFPVGLSVNNVGFEDSGFTVILSMLSDNGVNPSREFEFINSAGVSGDINLGGYGQIKPEGGTIIFNQFGREPERGITVWLDNVVVQGVDFKAPKGVSPGRFILDGSNSNRRTILKDCMFVNMLNPIKPFHFINCIIVGGRYGLLASNLLVEGLTIQDTTSYHLFMRPSIAGLIPGVDVNTYRDVKIIDTSTSSSRFAYIHNYRYGEHRGFTLINLDVEETVNPRIRVNNRYTAYNNNLFVAFTVNGRIVDSDGNYLENVNVSIRDKDDNLIFYDLTDSDGLFNESLVVYYHTTGTIARTWKDYYLEDENDWTCYFPFTLTVSKPGFVNYTYTLMGEGYDKTLSYIKQGAYFDIALTDVSLIGGYKGYIVSPMSTPGFEVVVVLFSLLFCIYVVRRKYK